MEKKNGKRMISIINITIKIIALSDTHINPIEQSMNRCE